MPLKVPELGAGVVCFLVLPQNWPWDNYMGLFGLKIGWDVARAFLTEAVLTVLPLDSVYSSGDREPQRQRSFLSF
jgi:hypothetical protein